MVSRLWHGWMTRDNAARIKELLRARFCRGFIASRDSRERCYFDDGIDEVKFVTLTLFDSMQAVKEFAGEDYEAAVILPEARKLLARFDARSAHAGTSSSRIVINSHLNLRCNTGQRSRRKTSSGAWVLEGGNSEESRTKEGSRGYNFSGILTEYLLIPAAPLGDGGAWSPYRTSHSVAV